LFRDRPESIGCERFQLIGVSLRDPHDFPNLDNDFGERQPLLLLCSYSRFYREAERIQECNESFVVPRDQVIGQPGNRN
jgi:hypothetical protein